LRAGGRPSLTLLQAIRDPNLFGPWFKDQATWEPWFAFIAALFGLGLEGDQRALFRSCTDRGHAPTAPFKEAFLVIGRRGGKSFILALIAVWLACFKNYLPYLQPGERATVLVVAVDRRQSRVIMRYVGGLLRGIPMLARLIERETTEAFDLAGRVTIEVATASFRTTRGYTICAALCDELAFWRSDDSANPDREILDAIRPAMATIPGAMLLCASSPYARRNVLWEAFQKFYGREDARVLVWKAPTRVMNPTVPKSTIDEAYEADPASAAAEYGAEFRTDVEGFVSREAIQRCIEAGVIEREPDPRYKYVAFTDPSGGQSDAFTLCVAHRDPAGKAILDAVRETRPPFAPSEVVASYAQLLRKYRITTVHGDAYSGQWCQESFRQNGVSYLTSERSKSQIYLDLLPRIMGSEVLLLDHKRLTAQFVGLERRTARGGRDTVDHQPGSHDDIANAAAGALVNVTASPVRIGNLQRKALTSSRPNPWRPQRPHNDRPKPGAQT
jgi:hypothetical protein